MPLINRFINLFTADAHAVLDRLEEPQVLLRQAIREMEEAVARMQIAGNVAAADNARDEDLLARERDIILAAGDELDTCLAAGADDLARNVIRRRLEAERRAAAITERLATRRKRSQAMTAELAGNRERLAAMREKQALFADGDAAGSIEPGSAGVSSEDVEIALLGEKERRARA